MNKFVRIAAIGMALCTLGTAFSGCGSKKEYTEYFSSITESCNAAVEITKGEIAVDESVVVSKSFEGVLENSNSYTYIQYDNGNPSTFRYSVEEGDSVYVLMKDERGVYEEKDGQFAEYTGEAPDFSEYIDVDFALDSVEEITVENGIKGTKLYVVKMTDAYADGFDADVNGGKYDCVEVTYVYAIDSLKRLKSVESMFTAKFTYNGETVDAVKQETVSFEALDVN